MSNVGQLHKTTKGTSHFKGRRPWSLLDFLYFSVFSLLTYHCVLGYSFSGIKETVVLMVGTNLGGRLPGFISSVCT